MSDSVRRVEVSSAGCPVCQEAVERVKGLVCPSCDVRVLDMHDQAVAERARKLGVRSVPAVAVDGILVPCSGGRDLDEEALRAAGLGARGAEAVEVEAALRQLRESLPLAERQRRLAAPVAAAPRAILRSFAEQGRPPTAREVLATAGIRALAELARNDLVALGTDGGADDGGERRQGHHPGAGGRGEASALRRPC